jgi:S-adenosylmethionine:tRNA ribosyltransferase-isomerase
VDLALFDYSLPPELIAQEPAEPRDAARLLVVDRRGGTWTDRRFADLPALLRPGDCLVVNESRVLPARLLGSIEPDGGPAELLMLGPLSATCWEALARPARRCRLGATVAVGQGRVRARVVGLGERGLRRVEVESPWPVREALERFGLPPLPPYIARHDAPKPEDRERYQTVYARDEGSVAAPTAGLHFTHALLDRVAAAGVEVHPLTLHVGPATFRPIAAGLVDAHRLPPEAIVIPDATAAAVGRARRDGRRVVAVGTTTTRALESAADAAGGVRPGPGAADLFIRPGHVFRVVDALVTNFHLPRSTLLVLVSAFAGRELILAAYRHAVGEGYRFYSYGDAMLIA